MKDSYWFKHDSNASSDFKLRALRKVFGWAGVGWYWFIIESLRSEDNYKLSYSPLTFGGLSTEFGCSLEEAQDFVDQCISPFRLFSKNDECFWSQRLCRDMGMLDEKRERLIEAGKISAEKRWSKRPFFEEQPKAEEKDFVTLYEQKTGHMATPPDLETIRDIMERHSIEEFAKALHEAVDKQVRSPMKYLSRILDNWASQKEPAETKTSVNMEGMTEAEE